MKDLLKNINNNLVERYWLLRFKKVTIYAFRIASNWESDDNIEQKSTLSALYSRLLRIRLLNQLSEQIHLTSLGNDSGSNTNAFCRDRKTDTGSLYRFQAFPPKCNTQLVYG